VGKSEVLKACALGVRLQHGYNSVIIAAKNNRAAKLVGGVTFASLLPIEGLKNKKIELRVAALAALRKRFTGVELLMLDEKSLVSLEDVFYLKFFLDLAFPERSHLPVSGFSIILIGDYYHLPPVEVIVFFSA